MGWRWQLFSHIIEVMQLCKLLFFSHVTCFFQPYTVFSKVFMWKSGSESFFQFFCSNYLDKILVFLSNCWTAVQMFSIIIRLEWSIAIKFNDVPLANYKILKNDIECFRKLVVKILEPARSFKTRKQFGVRCHGHAWRRDKYSHWCVKLHFLKNLCFYSKVRL